MTPTQETRAILTLAAKEAPEPWQFLDLEDGGADICAADGSDVGAAVGRFVAAFWREWTPGAVLGLLDERDRLRAEAIRLNIALGRYAWHQETCPFIQCEQECTCGLEAALEGVPPDPCAETREQCARRVEALSAEATAMMAEDRPSEGVALGAAVRWLTEAAAAIREGKEP